MNQKNFPGVIILLLAFCFYGTLAEGSSGEVRIEAVVLEKITEIFIPSSPEAVILGNPPMTINDFEARTNSLEANISFFVEKAFQMQISNRPDFSDASWEPFKKRKEWELVPGDGKKTVYARFKSLSGLMTDTVSDDIYLDTTGPANVSNFVAAAGDGKIELEWQNPADDDFQAVKIVRSEEFYPSGPDQGEPVYDGRGGSFTDNGLTNGKRYYYAAFAYDDLYNYSSGAIAAGTPQTPGEPQVLPPPTVFVPSPPEIEKLNLNDFDFTQEGKKVAPKKKRITIDDANVLNISIPYDKVPEALKTIMVTLQKGNKEFSFLLRANKEKTAYEAKLLPPEPGIYDFTIYILDYKNQAFKKITGQINIYKGQARIIAVKLAKKPRILPYVYILAAIILIETVRRLRRHNRKFQTGAGLKKQGTNQTNNLISR